MRFKRPLLPLASQVILTTKGNTYDGKTADIWSAGVMLYVMLVGAYPFERPEDKRDPQKLQKMIQRILHLDYKIPSHLKVMPANNFLPIICGAAYTRSVWCLSGHGWLSACCHPASVSLCVRAV